MAEFDYEVVDGRKIRVRPQEVVSEIDENGYFVRQPNHFTEGFGEGKNPVEKGRYHLVWAKLCHWSNRASIVRELLGLEDAISVNMVDHAKHVSYSRNIGPCKHRLVDYPNLWGYARDLYQIPAFRHNTYFKDFAASVDLNEADEEYSDADTSVFLQHVADGSQDFTIIDLAMYNSYMEEFNYDVQKNDIPEDEAKMIAENSYAYYIFPQDQKDLREQVDKALKELKEDGTLTEISKKWYGQDTAPEDDKFEETIN